MIHFEFAYFSLFSVSLSYSFGTETINTFVHSRGSLENHTGFQTKTAQTLPFEAAQTYMAYIGEYP